MFLHTMHLQEVSRQKDALTKILMNFNVHVDTPCCILTQEESKRLIHGSPKEKYDFFIRATGLQDLQRTMDDGRTATEEATKSKEIAIPDMLRKKKTMKVDRERLDRFTALSSIEDSINLAEAKKLWLVVESGKSVLQLAEDELTEKTGDVVEAEEAMQGVGGEADQAKVDAIEARMNELSAVGEQVGQNLTDKKAALQAVKRRQQTLANQKHGMENSKRDFVARTKVARTEVSVGVGGGLRV
jgi:chromosome segregation ATPase